MLNIKDIVTLSDDNQYQVISKTEYEGLIYYYIVDINDLTNIKFIYENVEYLTEVEDPELIKKLIPILYNEIKDLI